MTTETDGTIDQGFTLTAQNAVLGLQLTGNHTISRITLTNPDNAATYTLHCPAVQLHENQPTLFYIVIPPGKWNKGFRADIYAADQSLITTLATANTITFSTHEATIMAPRSLGLVFHINGLSLNMIYVEGGTFTMGATPEQEPYADDNEHPAHQVTLSSYYIAQTELTQALWTSLMGTTIQQHFEQHGSPDTPLAGEGPQHPMYKINKDDCQAFMNELNRLTGKHFRLPTEAEWEYAARGGIYSHSYIYPGGDNLMELAWYKENSNNLVHPVAQKMPNELGLYDMAGNVWEWVSDYYEPYPSTLQTNPTGSTTSTQPIIRGGSRANTYGANNCRVSARYADAIVRPKHRNFIGLRMVLPIE
jgi:formylglycine-generating enzyme required for sulfatase activity